MSSPAITPEPESITAELSDESGGQLVHLPESFRIPGKVVSIRRVEQGILLEPMQSRNKMTREEIRAMWADMDSYGADPLFPEGRMQGVAEMRLPIE
jgi:virulence-associated protein VagC